jgi:transcriptional regulator with XRE-family HTH domain
MYAAYKSEAPVKHAIKPTTLSKDMNRLDEMRSNVYQPENRIIKYFFAGTLGLLSPIYIQSGSATTNWSINQIAIEVVQVPKTLNQSASTRDILHIRQVLKVSITELARILGVSRQAIHDWHNGGSLSNRNAEKLSLLAKVADVFLDYEVDISPQILRRNVGASKSLLDSFKEGGNIIQEAKLLAGTLAREAKQRQRMSERLSNRLKVELPVSAFGLAHLNEKS